MQLVAERPELKKARPSRVKINRYRAAQERKPKEFKGRLSRELCRRGYE
ncbi:hypothetical protein NTGZN8_130231 [Candidatus Nitrotoga fabula]|uniref:Uncharacterized protein n=1 Tax=Candidatus Nitrotoga fabula TaxID=2182327 RepID=A0A916FAE1_9PROT|nr:hypothetical protein NTGZN8_130231 [Candidatus Nitrotoga fabula]